MNHLTRIVGVNVKKYTSHTYETEYPGSIRIVHDTITGQGITKTQEFTSYTLYVELNAFLPANQKQSNNNATGETNADGVVGICDNDEHMQYVAIHLSESHCATFRGKLGKIAYMYITPSNYKEVVSNSTHFPLTPLDITGLKIKDMTQDYHEDDTYVRLTNDTNACVFKFSNTGNDENNPCGYVYVNMGLFINR